MRIELVWRLSQELKMENRNLDTVPVLAAEQNTVAAAGTSGTPTRLDHPPGTDEPSALRELLEKLELMADGAPVLLRYEVHADTGRVQVQVLNAVTGEVIEEVPPDRYLDMIAKMARFIRLLVEENHG